MIKITPNKILLYIGKGIIISYTLLAIGSLYGTFVSEEEWHIALGFFIFSLVSIFVGFMYLASLPNFTFSKEEIIVKTKFKNKHYKISDIIGYKEEIREVRSIQTYLFILKLEDNTAIEITDKFNNFDEALAFVKTNLVELTEADLKTYYDKIARPMRYFIGIIGGVMTVLPILIQINEPTGDLSDWLLYGLFLIVGIGLVLLALTGDSKIFNYK